jgi:hypothetical protein
MEGRALGDGTWIKQMKTAWSIFAKVEGVLAPSIVPASASGNAACGWEVHYDLWLSTFVRGEYEPPNQLGGGHCMTACCHDPNCKGLALMSNEEYQCYEYKNLPTELAASRGAPLGNGQWLRQRKSAWSIFVKTAAPNSVLPAATVSSAPGASAISLRRTVNSSSLSRDIASSLHGDMPRPAVGWLAPWAVISRIFVLTSVSFAAFLLASARFPVVERYAMIMKNYLNLHTEPETRKLLQGIDMTTFSDSHTACTS